MEGERVDLLQRFGRDRIERLALFATAEACTDFLKGCAYNENKSIRQTEDKGLQRKWTGYSGTTLCFWFVIVSKKRPSSAKPGAMRRTKLSGIPAGFWYISKFNLNHSDMCTCVREVSSRLVVQMPRFQSTLVKGLDSSATRVIRSIQKAHAVDLSTQPALLYRAIAAYKKTMDAEDDGFLNYKNLTSFLTAFNQSNPAPRIVCQLDNNGRFFRLFLSVGHVIQGQYKWLQVLENDGTHMRSSAYNGICLTLVGKSGNGTNIPAAVAFVHKETTDNFAWFYANCLAAGIYFLARPLFSDRGKQLEAQQLLARIGLQINLKFCPLHLEFNTIHRFKSVTPEVGSRCPSLYKLQAATSLTGYDRVLDEVRAAYPVPLRHEDGTTELVEDYLEKIHPTSWTRVGNYIHSEAERDSFLNWWPNTPTYGEPLPLFGTRTASANEGENNALNWNQLRLEDVLLLSFCERFMFVCNRHRNQATTRLNGAFNLTPRAKQHVDAEIATIPSVSVQHSNENEYYVDETNESTDNKTYTRRYHVDISLGSCIRCPVREHHQIPCCHLLATIMHARGQDPITKDELERVFHPAYLVQEYSQAFQPVAIALPLEPDLHDKDDIQPPPLSIGKLDALVLLAKQETVSTKINDTRIKVKDHPPLRKLSTHLIVPIHLVTCCRFCKIKCNPSLGFI